MRNFQKTDLPVGWVNITVGDAVINISTNGKKIRQKEYAERGHYAVIDQGQELIGGYTNDENKLVDCQLPVIIFGDHTRVIKYVNRPFAAGADGIKVLQPHEFIAPKYLEYSLRFFSEGMTSKGYARHYQHLAKSLIPLPPLAEQRRIVAKIEELLSELDKGIESLKTAREQLKVYRQALLKHAFEGKLTAAWREQNQDKLETAEGLLERIQVERDACRGTARRAPTKRANCKDLPPLTAEELAELPELPELPQGWGWVRLGNIAELAGGVTKGKNLDGKEIISLPYLRVANVQDGHLDLSEIKYIDVEKQDGIKYELKFGDVLYTEGGDKDKLGRGAVWLNQVTGCIHQNHIFRARIFDETVLPNFLSLFSQTKTAKKYFFRHGKQTTNLASINLTVLSNFPVVVCSKYEQIELLNIIDEKLSEIDNLDQTITTALQQSESLRQSVLKKAFSGQLVPQDPHDEPAAVLLERIRAERTCTETRRASVKPGRRKTKHEAIHD